MPVGLTTNENFETILTFWRDLDIIFFIHTFKGEPFFLFVLKNKEVVGLSKQFLSVCFLSFRWVKKIHLSKFVSEPLEIGKCIIAITEQYEYTRKIPCDEVLSALGG